MSEVQTTEPGEVTLDGALKEHIRELITGLEIAQNLALTLREAKDSEKSMVFYRALNANLRVAEEYVLFSTTDYLRSKSPKQ